MKIKKIIIQILTVLAILFAIGAMATEVTFLPLEKTIDKNTIIIEAKVENINKETGEEVLRIICNIKIISTIRGKVPNQISKLMYYRQSLNLSNSEGEIVGHFSPILKASGIELFLQSEKTYLFFLEKIDSKNNMVNFFRAEPLKNKEKVIDILKKQH